MFCPEQDIFRSVCTSCASDVPGYAHDAASRSVLPDGRNGHLTPDAQLISIGRVRIAAVSAAKRCPLFVSSGIFWSLCSAVRWFDRHRNESLQDPSMPQPAGLGINANYQRTRSLRVRIPAHLPQNLALTHHPERTMRARCHACAALDALRLIHCYASTQQLTTLILRSWVCCLSR